jgi:glyoxylase-like metal-dependent hydrolase (beta-lactamase superfamily II)
MIATHILPHLHQLVIPTPFPVGPVNVYLCSEPDEPLTLIDTGPRTGEAQEELEKDLALLGHRLADVGRIVISHAHTDHYGLTGDITRLSGARVYSHPFNAPLLENHATERERRARFFRELLAQAGMPEDLQRAVAQILNGFQYLAADVRSLLPLDEGDTLKLAGHEWDVLFLPGHAGGLICLYQPQTKLLLSSDHLLRDVSSNPLFEPPPPGGTERRRSLVDYIASLERTAAMDIAVAWPGHGEPIYEHRRLIESRLAFHHERAGRILDALNDRPRTVYELSQMLFAHLDPMGRFLALSEVLAHLEWLEVRGQATSQTENGVALWRQAQH